ncbi:MAG: nickel pincer cofactor biosynthesis protein LarC [Deltaproteobacteria bacterium]|nr:nickel pincer cofactor biosynthesis protein LarC [Deltaproteobacteria bacterium]
MRILYIDPVTGLSGDMVLSALIDAGFPLDEIRKILKKLPFEDPSILPEKVDFGTFSGTRIKMGSEDLRLTAKEMLNLAQKIDVHERVKKDVLGMLNLLFDAEAKIHGVKKEDIHLHELSSVDTFLDFLLVASGIFYFSIDKVYVGLIPHGTGFIKTAHGTVPNPPPLTLEILSGFESRFTSEPYELTTPTGATIVKYYADPEERLSKIKVSHLGFGLGNYKMEKPDVLRVYIGEKDTDYLEDEVTIIEFDVDDMDMEYTGLFSDLLRASGAIEVVYFPVYMKKGRIGIRFSIIVANEKESDVIDTVFKNSTTFGLRIKKESRKVLKREEKTVRTKYGNIRIKVGFGKHGEILKEHVEFDDIKKICEEKNLSYTTVLKEIKRNLLKN